MTQERLEEVYRSFYERGVTDGLPVVPPTDERVEAMLAGTDHDPDTEIARLGDREGILTVETLAVNGVMAGCLPIHMPVLIAAARAQSEPGSSIIEASVGTGSAGHLYLVNGPIREQLDINSGVGAFGPGFRSNRTIGRALALALQNTAKILPGEQAMGVIGCPFKTTMVAGENEEKSPWEPFHVERGYDADESAISLTNPNCFIQTSARGPNRDEKEVLSKLIYNTPPEIRFRPNAVYALSPTNAYELRNLTKREVKAYIYENTVIDSHTFYEADPSSYGFDSAEPDSVNVKSTDSDVDVPPLKTRLYRDPSQIKLFVTGGEGAWNAILGPLEGGPTTKTIELPDNWDELLERYRPQLEREWGVGWLRR